MHGDEDLPRLNSWRDKGRGQKGAPTGHGPPVAMERKVALSNLQLFVSFLGHAKWPQLAPKDLFWNGKMVATQHVKVLVTERRESSEVFFLWVGSGRTQVI